MKPLTSKTNPMMGSFILMKSTLSPPPIFTKATLASTPTSQPLLVWNCFRASSVFHCFSFLSEMMRNDRQSELSSMRATAA